MLQLSYLVGELVNCSATNWIPHRVAVSWYDGEVIWLQLEGGIRVHAFECCEWTEPR